MCGITGFVCPPLKDEFELRSCVERMNDRLAHRGPDDSGTWVDPPAGIALGVRRLAIVDLSPAGHQPMVSADGRYVIAFNGEVYNFSELRKELEPKGHKFRGHSDTEVMLAAVSEWGLVTAVRKFVGMFAFGLWDRRDRALHLVRDRLGIKPLYYGQAGQTFLFASELKALRCHPAFRAEINRDAVALLMRHNCIPQPYTIYQGISKLPGGCIVTLKPKDGLDTAPSPPLPYWSAQECAERKAAKPFQGTEAEAVEQLDALLREAVKLRLVADVPLGAFLSGGIDSSTVVALMQAQSLRPVKTFTIGFHEDPYNEAREAKAVAEHLHTEHAELYVTPEEARAVIPRLPEIFDEPFSDSSEIPTYLVSALARQDVTVSLSGDGGDELFGGYSRYPAARTAWRGVGWAPRPLRRLLGRLLGAPGPTTYNRRLGWLAPWFDRYGQSGSVGEKIHKLAELLEAQDAEDFYRQWMSHWKRPTELVLGAADPPTVYTEVFRPARFLNFTQRMMFFDLVGYLPDDILTKVDRASMAVSLEARVPLLDHRVVEFAASLPLSMKIRDRQGKWLLRQVLYRYLPRDVIDRPKKGFEVPIGEWLRGPLREWATALLEEGRLRREGFFHPEPIGKLWTQHLSAQYNWQYCLWDVLMFQAWLEKWC